MLEMAAASSRRNGVAASRGSSSKTAKVRSQPKACSHRVTKRLRQDLASLTLDQDLVDQVSAFPFGDNLFHWTATMYGVKDTPYEGLVYKLSLEFTDRYPNEAPRVKFTTPCFHPNVDDNGNICLDILKDQWAASMDVRNILISIRSLLGEPNNQSPLNSYAASLWSNQEEYTAVVRKKYEAEVRSKLSD